MKKHYWWICPMCGPVVCCGTCGNNACNGGYGKVDGVTCTECPSAYAMMFAYDKNIFNGIKYYQSKSSKKKMWERFWGSMK